MIIKDVLSTHPLVLHTPIVTQGPKNSVTFNQSPLALTKSSLLPFSRENKENVHLVPNVRALSGFINKWLPVFQTCLDQKGEVVEGPFSTGEEREMEVRLEDSLMLELTAKEETDSIEGYCDISLSLSGEVC